MAIKQLLVEVVERLLQIIKEWLKTQAPFCACKKSGSDDHIHDDIGFNYRMTNLMAVGCAQMENLKNILKAKRKNYETYKNLFKNEDDVEI